MVRCIKLSIESTKGLGYKKELSVINNIISKLTYRDNYDITYKIDLGSKTILEVYYKYTVRTKEEVYTHVKSIEHDLQGEEFFKGIVVRISDEEYKYTSEDIEDIEYVNEVQLDIENILKGDFPMFDYDIDLEDVDRVLMKLKEQFTKIVSRGVISGKDFRIGHGNDISGLIFNTHPCDDCDTEHLSIGVRLKEESNLRGIKIDYAYEVKIGE